MSIKGVSDSLMQQVDFGLFNEPGRNNTEHMAHGVELILQSDLGDSIQKDLFKLDRRLKLWI